MALRQLKPKNLWAVDINESSLKAAEEMGVIDKGYLKPEIPLAESDITIICLYPDLVFNFVNTNVDKFKKGSIITDAVGVKGKLLDKVRKVLKDRADFIGGHPMAGKECSGFGVASKDIFIDANYILTPLPDNKKENVELIENIVMKIGCKKVIRVSPEKHDELIAFTSQLPHVIAAALIENSSLEESKFLIGGSFKDATRVAQINSLLWPQLLIDNSDNIVNQIEAFEESMERIKNLIKNKDKNKLKTLFEDTSKKREELLR